MSRAGWRIRCRDCGTLTNGSPIQLFEVGKYFCNVKCYRNWRKSRSS